MGNVSSEIGKSVVNQVNNIVTQISANAIASNETNTTLNNTVNASLGVVQKPNGDVYECKNAIFQGVQITQRSGATKTLKADTNTKAAVTLKNDLGNQLQLWASQASDQQAQWLSTAVNVSVKDQSQFVNAVNNIVSNIDVSAQSECKDFTYDSNTLTVAVCGVYYKDVVFDQENSVTIASSCLANVLFNAISSNQALNDGIVKAEQQANQASQGIYGPLEDLLYIFAIVVIVMVIIGVFSYMFHSSKKKQMPQYPPYNPYQYNPYPT